MKTKLPDYFFVSDSDGGLYDTRKINWHAFPPLRPNYKKHPRTVNSTGDLKASLRVGDYAWPGGYEIVYITSDGALLCGDCVRKNIRSCFWSLRANCSDGWEISGVRMEAVSAENSSEDCRSRCENCNKEFGELM